MASGQTPQNDVASIDTNGVTDGDQDVTGASSSQEDSPARAPAGKRPSKGNPSLQQRKQGGGRGRGRGRGRGSRGRSVSSSSTSSSSESPSSVSEPESESEKDAVSSSSSDSGASSAEVSVDEEGDEDFLPGRNSVPPIPGAKPTTAGPGRKSKKAALLADIEPPKRKFTSKQLRAMYGDGPGGPKYIPVNEPPEVYSVSVTDEDGTTVTVPATAFADLLSAYHILRAFSWQIKLSPFPLQSFIVAMASGRPSSLVDEVHVAVLRALAASDNARERKRRSLDLRMLDTISWPEYMWEWLQLQNDKDLISLRARNPSASLPNGAGPAVQPLTKEQVQEMIAGVAGASVVQNPLAITAGDDAAADANGDMMAVDKVNGNNNGGGVYHAETMVVVSIEERRRRALEAATAPGFTVAVPGRKDIATLWTAGKDGERVPASSNAYNKSSLKTAWSGCLKARTQPSARRVVSDYYNLGITANARILARMVDDLLESPVIRQEIDRRENCGLMHAGRGGAGGGFAMRSAEDRKKLLDKKAEQAAAAIAAASAAAGDGSAAASIAADIGVLGEDGRDGNVDRCVLCGVAGSLLCCDTCPAAYHLKCLGHPEGHSVPQGEWQCPECSCGGRGEAAGVRIPMCGLQPPVTKPKPAWVAYGCLFRQHGHRTTQGFTRYGGKVDMRNAAQMNASKAAKGPGSEGGTAGAGGDPSGEMGDDDDDACNYVLPADMTDDGVTVCVGAEADRRYKELLPYRPRNKDERPHPSSISGVMPGEGSGSEDNDDDNNNGTKPITAFMAKPSGASKSAQAGDGPKGLAAGPHSGINTLGQPVPRPDTYVNRYKTAWQYAMSAYRAHLDTEHRRLRRIAGGAAQLQQMAMPLPLSKWNWPVAAVSKVRQPTRRCGECDHCVKPNVRRACLNPQPAEPTPLPHQPPTKLSRSVGRLAVIQNWLLRAERHMSGVLEGPWSGSPEAVLQWRKVWIHNVKSATDILTTGKITALPIPDAARAAMNAGTAGGAGNGSSRTSTISTSGGSVGPTIDASTMPADPASLVFDRRLDMAGFGVVRGRPKETVTEPGNAAAIIAAQEKAGLLSPDERGRAAVRQLATCVMQLEAAIRRHLHVTHSNWDPNNRPGRLIKAIWGMGNGSEAAAHADPNHTLMRLRKLRKPLKPRPPRQIEIPEDADGPVSVFMFTFRKANPKPTQQFRKKGSVDPGEDGEGGGEDGDMGEGGDGGDNGDGNANQMATTGNAKSGGLTGKKRGRRRRGALPKKRARRSTRPGGPGRGGRRGRPAAGAAAEVDNKSEGDDDDDEGDSEGDDGDDDGAGGDGAGATTAPGSAVKTEMKADDGAGASGEAAVQVKSETPAEGAGNGDGDGSTAAPTAAGTPMMKTEEEGDAMDVDVKTEKSEPDHTQQGEEVDEEELERRQAAEKAQKALIRKLKRAAAKIVEPRVRQPRAAAIAAVSRTQGQLSGKMGMMGPSVGVTPGAALTKKEERRQARRAAASNLARSGIRGLTDPRGYATEESSGGVSSASDAGDWWLDGMEDMQEELIRHAHKPAIISGWQWVRTAVGRAQGSGYLPAKMAKKLARQGGALHVPEAVRYHQEPGEQELVARVTWLASLEKVTTSAALALQIRHLDKAIRWSHLKRPLPDPEAQQYGYGHRPGYGGHGHHHGHHAQQQQPPNAAFYNLVLCAKRQLKDPNPELQGYHEYFVVPEGATAQEVLAAMSAVDLANATTAAARKAAEEQVKGAIATEKAIMQTLAAAAGGNTNTPCGGMAVDAPSSAMKIASASPMGGAMPPPGMDAAAGNPSAATAAATAASVAAKAAVAAEAAEMMARAEEEARIADAVAAVPVTQPSIDAYVDRPGDDEPFMCYWAPEFKFPLFMVKAFEDRVASEDAANNAAANPAVSDTAREAMEVIGYIGEEEDATCGTCRSEHGARPDADHLWIKCNSCSSWHHGDCAGVNHGAAEMHASTDAPWNCRACLSSYRTRRSAAANRRGRPRSVWAQERTGPTGPTPIIRIRQEDGVPDLSPDLEALRQQIAAQQQLQAQQAAVEAAAAEQRRQQQMMMEHHRRQEARMYHQGGDDMMMGGYDDQEEDEDAMMGRGGRRSRRATAASIEPLTGRSARSGRRRRGDDEEDEWDQEGDDDEEMGAGGGRGGGGRSRRRGAGRRARAEDSDDDGEEQYDSDDDAVGQPYCVCRRPYTKDQADDMVACDSCDQWYHYYCVGLPKPSDLDEAVKWFCPNCQKDMEQRAAKREKQARKRAEAAGGGAASGAAGGYDAVDGFLGQGRPSVGPSGAAAAAAGGYPDDGSGGGARVGGKAGGGRKSGAALAQLGTSIGPELAAVAVQAGYNWQVDAAMVLEKLMQMDQAEVFSEPVDENDVPDYYEVITNPMDLGTIQDRLQAGNVYRSPDQMLADVNLVWSNCHIYNKPKSIIAQHANACAKQFKQLWAQASIEQRIQASAAMVQAREAVAAMGGMAAAAGQQPGMAASGMQAAQQYAHAAVRRRPPGTNPGQYMNGIDDEEDATGNTTAMNDDTLLDNWAAKAKIVLKALMREPSALPFTRPVDLDQVPDYMDLVAEPMDLTTIANKVNITMTSSTPAQAHNRGGYPPTGQGLMKFLEEVQLVWSNCKAYNDPTCGIINMAIESRRALKRHAKQHGLPTSLNVVKTALAVRELQAASNNAAAQPQQQYQQMQQQYQQPQQQYGQAQGYAQMQAQQQQQYHQQQQMQQIQQQAAVKASGRGGGARASGNAADWMKRAQEVVKQVKEDPECGWPFAKPVKASEAPGYFDIIKRPMDLGTIEKKLRKKEYSSEQEMLADVDQVWKNCFAYNEEGDDFYNMGVAARALFNRNYVPSQTGVPPAQQQQQYAAYQQQQMQQQQAAAAANNSRSQRSSRNARSAAAFDRDEDDEEFEEEDDYEPAKKPRGGSRGRRGSGAAAAAPPPPQPAVMAQQPAMAYNAPHMQQQLAAAPPPSMQQQYQQQPQQQYNPYGQHVAVQQQQPQQYQQQQQQPQYQVQQMQQQHPHAAALPRPGYMQPGATFIPAKQPMQFKPVQRGPQPGQPGAQPQQMMVQQQQPQQQGMQQQQQQVRAPPPPGMAPPPPSLGHGQPQQQAVAPPPPSVQMQQHYHHPQQQQVHMAPPPPGMQQQQTVMMPQPGAQQHYQQYHPHPGHQVQYVMQGQPQQVQGQPQQQQQVYQVYGQQQPQQQQQWPGQQ